MRKGQKLEECVEDLVLNLPSLLCHGQYPRQDFLESNLLQQKELGEYGFYSIGVSSKLIEKILFEKGFKLEAEALSYYKKNYSFPLEIKSPTEWILKGLELAEEEKEKVPSLLKRAGIVEENGIIFPFFYQNNPLQFYHGFDTEIKEDLFNELSEEDAVYNFSGKGICFSTDPAYANKFGKVVLAFDNEKYKKSKIEELKKFKEFLTFDNEKSPFGYSVYKGNIYLGKKDRYGVYYQWDPSSIFSLSSNKKIVHDLSDRKGFMPTFSKRAEIIEHSTNFEYDEEMFSELEFGNLSEVDKNKLLGFNSAEQTEIRMKFDSSYISSSALTGIYLPKNKRREMEGLESFEKFGEDYFFKTKKKSIPIYFTNNIPRKINHQHRRKYFQENET